MNIKNNISETVGNTPLMRLKKIEEHYGLDAKLYGKMEKFNPAGSVKDRIALALIDDAEKKGQLKEGGTIIEPTSGNTGIGLAAIGVPRGYNVILAMPETMSVERQKLMKSLGAELVLTDGKKGMSGAIAKAKEIHEQTEGSMIAGQFTNPICVEAHKNTTGPEIWYDTDGRIDAFVSAVGTGGTITGTGQFLKSKNKDIDIIAVEPSNSPVLSGGDPGPHKIQGIGAGFIPEILDTQVYDIVTQVKDEDAFETGRLFGKEEGINVGISSGAALWAAIEYGKQDDAKGKSIVVILPDTGERYISTDMFR